MYQMQATFTAKSLSNALTIVRKGAKIRSGENWLETADHKYGTDHVLIRIVNGTCTLYTVSQPGEGQACTFVRCERLAHVAYIDGECAVPIRVLHDYVKTFGASDEIRIEADDVRSVVDTPASHTYHTEANTYKRIRTETPATYRDEYAIIIRSGRNVARVIGKQLTQLAWMGDALLFGQVTPSEVAEQERAALLASIKPVRTVNNVAPAPAMHGPAFVAKPRVRVPLATMQVAPVAPVGTPPGIPVPATVKDVAAFWRACCKRAARKAGTPVPPTPAIPDWAHKAVDYTKSPAVIDEADDTITATIEAITGEDFSDHFAAQIHESVEALRAWNPARVIIAEPATVAPTPIYTPRVGDTVAITYQHERMTTDRVVNVQRVAADGKTFRGYDRTYDRVRNYDMTRVVSIRPVQEGADIAAG